MQGVVEEKQQRIAEVLLGCIAPFELMLGKLLGMVGVSLTLLGFYSVGGGIAASRYGVAALLSPALVGWFALFVVLAALMYGSIFLAVGAAASDMKETQALQLPIVLLATAPIMLVRAIVRNPTGKIAIIGSFFPFSAPMLMSARLAMANPVPWWHPAVASLGVLASALFCVWAAGRIFRIGLLLQGTSVRWTDLGRWILGRER